MCVIQAVENVDCVVGRRARISYGWTRERFAFVYIHKV